ncbi:ExbD/TolR family protein, partial [Aeromonas salmonicida]|uniref:ExbD/TolR family protein n=1 Tax=Aeromonas salmonicida TaxID=645 RepID=UPI003CFF0CC4
GDGGDQITKSSVSSIQAASIWATTPLAIDGTGKIYWNDKEVDEAALLAQMETAGKAEGELPEIQLRIDKRVEYGIIARVMAQASQHGLHKIAFVSQPDGK